MAPPPGRPAQPQQPRRLRGHAVDRHLLLLLAQGGEEAGRVHAEAEHAHERDRHQRQARLQRHPRARPRVPARQHQERQRQPSGQLDAHARRQHARAGAQAPARAGAQAPARAGAQAHTRPGAQAKARAAGPGGERQRCCQREDQQRVVVRPADAQHERHRVEPYERRRPTGRVTEASRRLCDQRDRADAAEHRDRLERPQRARDPERHERIAGDGEQRSIRRALERPADEAEHRVGRRFRGHVRIRVKAVQRSQSRV
jgi:hypothetical protein